MYREDDSIIFGKEIIKSKDAQNHDQDDYIKLSDQARLSNLMVLSTKNSGKTRYLIPAMVKQDLENREAGMTIVVGRSEIAYELYAMALMAKRKPVLLKPSSNFTVLNQLLYAKSWDYKMINDDIINYKEAIRLKKVVIIDMETEYYSMHSIKAVDMLLMQLQSDMMDTEVTGRRRHFVYIDEAYRYLDFLNNLLEYGDNYNVSTTLFFQSRSQFVNENKDYSTLINNNVRNTILMQGITYEDALYYSRFLFERNEIQTLLNRSFGQFTYSLLREGTNSRIIGTGQLLLLEPEEQEIIHRKALACRRKLLKELKQKVIGKRMQLFQEREALETLNLRLDKDSDESYLNSIEENIMEAALPSLEDIDASCALNEHYDENDMVAYDDSELMKELNNNDPKDLPTLQVNINNGTLSNNFEDPIASTSSGSGKIDNVANEENYVNNQATVNQQPDVNTVNEIIPENNSVDIQHKNNKEVDENTESYNSTTQAVETSSDNQAIMPNADDLPVFGDEPELSFGDGLDDIEIDTSLINDMEIPDPLQVMGSVSGMEVSDGIDLGCDENFENNLQNVPLNEILLKDDDNISNEESEKFNIDHCEFIIGGKIETNLSKGAISSKPIRIKMPYKEMRNNAINKQFENFFN